MAIPNLAKQIVLRRNQPNLRPPHNRRMRLCNIQRRRHLTRLHHTLSPPSHLLEILLDLRDLRFYLHCHVLLLLP